MSEDPKKPKSPGVEALLRGPVGTWVNQHSGAAPGTPWDLAKFLDDLLEQGVVVLPG